MFKNKVGMAYGILETFRKVSKWLINNQLYKTVVSENIRDSQVSFYYRTS